MRCPICGHLEDKVVDSRSSRDGTSIRRRRECLSCSARFTSYERIEESLPQVIKKDGAREDFDSEKIRQGIRLACKKLSISTDQIDDVVRAIEKRIIEKNVKEIPAREVGDAVMEELRGLDPVAYIRFASVYREFGDIQEFLHELRGLDKESK